MVCFVNVDMFYEVGCCYRFEVCEFLRVLNVVDVRFGSSVRVVIEVSVVVRKVVEFDYEVDVVMIDLLVSFMLVCYVESLCVRVSRTVSFEVRVIEDMYRYVVVVFYFGIVGEVCGVFVSDVECFVSDVIMFCEEDDEDI